MMNVTRADIFAEKVAHTRLPRTVTPSLWQIAKSASIYTLKIFLKCYHSQKI